MAGVTTAGYFSADDWRGSHVFENVLFEGGSSGTPHPRRRWLLSEPEGRLLRAWFLPLPGVPIRRGQGSAHQHRTMGERALGELAG